jgi:hypothetical protein
VGRVALRLRSPQNEVVGLLVHPFPMPGRRVALAYQELNIAANGTPEQKAALGPLADLPKPWEPETCEDPALRSELWSWLEDFAIWLNHEYAWDIASLIPACWPRHPHIVHEMAVLADQRRRTTPRTLQRSARGVAPLRTSILHRPHAQSAPGSLLRWPRDLSRARPPHSPHRSRFRRGPQPRVRRRLEGRSWLRVKLTSSRVRARLLLGSASSAPMTRSRLP